MQTEMTSNINSNFDNTMNNTLNNAMDNVMENVMENDNGSEITQSDIECAMQAFMEEEDNTVDETEREVKAKIREFIIDYEDSLPDALVTTLQYYFVSLVVYASRKGECCVSDDTFRKQFCTLKDTVVSAVSRKKSMRTIENDIERGYLLDEFSKLYATLSSVSDSNLVATRECTMQQMEKVKVLLFMIEQYLANRLRLSDLVI